MKARFFVIGALLLLCISCHTPTREARRMVKRAERLADTLPDSTVCLIDSVLRMPVYFSERERMEMALLQAEALFGCKNVSRNVSTISPVMDDDFFDDHANLSTSPELERAAAYFAQKKQYEKAAHAALYSGFVQQHYNEKEAAMRSFKEAEQYGGLAEDSLTVAQAEYLMGKQLLYEGMESELVDLLESSDCRFGINYREKALVKNLLAATYLLMDDYTNAKTCLDQSLAFATQTNFTKAKKKALNNYAVLYQLLGQYNQAIDYLRQVVIDSDSTELLIAYLNMGNTFFVSNEFDSASFYYSKVRESLHTSNSKTETTVSALAALSRFAEKQGDTFNALQYEKEREGLLSEIMNERHEQAVYRIQKQYDFEAIRNEMSKRIIFRQRIITLLSIVAVLGLIAFAASQVRLAKIRKREAEANANLFHFMQQNKALVENDMAHKKEALDMAKQLSDLLYSKVKTMQQLDYCIKTPKDKIALKDLELEVFGSDDHWNAIKDSIVALYPGLLESIMLKYPDMDELEIRVCLLSRLKLSRNAEATLLGISTSVLDKYRTKVRKIMAGKA